jgi:SRSO17 transposase
MMRLGVRDDQRMTGTAADWAAGHLCAGQDPGDVVLTVDETGDAKTSGDCAGAARQYSGTLGGIVMCQVAVTLTCAAPAGHALISRALLRHPRRTPRRERRPAPAPAPLALGALVRWVCKRGQAAAEDNAKIEALTRQLAETRAELAALQPKRCRA